MTDKTKGENDAVDNDESDFKSGVSRRDIMKVGAITAATLAAPTLLLNQGAKSMADAQKDKYEADLVIIGTGFAGIFAAIEATKHGKSVVMVDKGSVGWSGLSPWASDSRPFDKTIYNREEWIHNISTNTEWINDRKWLDIFLDESLDIFYILREMGAHDTRPFERSSVFRQAMTDRGVTLVERTMITSLLQDENGRVGGVLGFTFDDSAEPSKAVVVKGKAVILCTGAGGYKSPGFPNWGNTFDGDAMAYDVGAYITGKEFHDTHTTFSKLPAASYDGWIFAQKVKGAYIMVGAPDPVHGGLNLDGALRTSVGNVIRLAGVGPGGELPTEGEHPDKAKNRKLYKGKGFLNPDVNPGMTYDWGGPPDGKPPGGGKIDYGFRVGGSTAGMGVHKGEGIFNSDYTCRADGVEGLYAAGDSLGSYLCGSSYPARGFSSYGSAIQGRMAARHAAKAIENVSMPTFSKAYLDKKKAQMWAPRENERGFSPEWVTSVLQNTMTPFHILYIKEERRLEGALASIEYIRREIVPKMIAEDGHQLRMAHEAANMLLNAEMKLRAGLFRKESRGTHFREDYPARDDDEWFCWINMNKGPNGEMVMSKYMLPEEWKPTSNDYRKNYPRPYPGEDEYLAKRI